MNNAPTRLATCAGLFLFACHACFVAGIDDGERAQVSGLAVTTRHTCEYLGGGFDTDLGSDAGERGHVAEHVGVRGIRQWAIALACLDAATQFVGLRRTPRLTEVVVIVAQVADGLIID